MYLNIHLTFTIRAAPSTGIGSNTSTFGGIEIGKVLGSVGSKTLHFLQYCIAS